MYKNSRPLARRNRFPEGRLSFPHDRLSVALRVHGGGPVIEDDLIAVKLKGSCEGLCGLRDRDVQSVEVYHGDALSESDDPSHVHLVSRLFPWNDAPIRLSLSQRTVHSRVRALSSQDPRARAPRTRDRNVILIQPHALDDRDHDGTVAIRRASSTHRRQSSTGPES